MEMETKTVATLPNGDRIEFYPEGHKYFVNGTEVLSVTALITKVYGDKYAAVNPDLLKRSAEYGTKVHKELQDLIELRKDGIDIDPLLISQTQETQNYFNMVEPIYNIEPLQLEQMVVLYDEKGVPVAAGRFDLLCKVNKVITLCDFKTTSSINTKLVSAQLNLYCKACVQSGICSEDEIKQLGVIHLSGATCKYKPVTKFNDEFIKKIIEAERTDH